MVGTAGDLALLARSRRLSAPSVSTVNGHDLGPAVPSALDDGGQLVAQFIGGTLEDDGDSMDRAMGAQRASTRITGIELRPNGTDSAFFVVQGEAFECGFCTTVGGVSAGDEGWLTFSGYGGHRWRIREPQPVST